MKKKHVVTAQRLTDGVVVFSGDAGWVENIRAAAIAATPEELDRRIKAAEEDVSRREIVGVYAIEVEDHGLGPRPVRFRERLRAAGPTVRPDLNREEPAQP